MMAAIEFETLASKAARERLAAQTKAERERVAAEKAEKAEGQSEGI